MSERKKSRPLVWGDGWGIPTNCITCATMWISPIFAEAISTVLLQEKHAGNDAGYKRQLARETLQKFHDQDHK